MWTRKDWLILAGVTLLAAMFRLAKLGEIPPGFQFDEAFNAIDARQVLEGNYPLFLPANGGREVLYTYWQALLGALLGVNVYTLRLASTLVGILAIPATYVMLRRIIAVNSRFVAGFTALVLAINLWHVHFSRYGIRVILMPLLLCGLFLFFWLGGHASTRRRRLWFYAVSGLLVGLTPWAHPTGRFVPVILIAYVIWILLRRPERRRWHVDSSAGGLLITGVVAFLVFLPLGLEFVQHPEFFLGHASEVSVFADRVSGGRPLSHLVGNLLRIAGMFSVTGDTDWTHNLAGRPVFDWLMSVPFVIGLVLWVWRLRRVDDPDFDALSLLALWTLFMLLPSVLSEAAPNYSRALPAQPAVFTAAGLGLTWLAMLERPVRWFGPALAALILLFSAGSTVNDYFVRFARAQEVYYTYDADKLDALEYLAELTGDNRVFLSQLWGEKHATVYYLRGQLGIDSIDTSETVVLPPVGLGLVYGFPAEQHERAEQIAALWSTAQLEDLTDAYGNHLITVVRVPAGAAADWPARLAPEEEFEAHFFEAPTLLGMRSDADDPELTLFWRSDQETFRDLTTFVHLVDQEGRRIGQADKLPANGSYRTPYWTVGDRVVDRYAPEITDLCAGGEPVRVEVGWYQYLADNARMQRTDMAGDSALAGFLTLPVESHPADRFAPSIVLSDPADSGLALAGADLRSVQYESGSPLTLDLLWAGGPDHADDNFSISLRRGTDEQQPAPGEVAVAPSASWHDGELICRRLRTHIPPETTPGRYEVVVVTADAERMLGEIEIAASNRVYELPDAVNPIDTLFEALIGLHGYNLTFETVDDNSELVLTLIWQALVAPTGAADVPHKVFVHVIDEKGEIVAQSDAEPAGGYGTNEWLPGEVITDTHRIPLPSRLKGQSLRILVGLYEPIGGRRLRPAQTDGKVYPEGAVSLTEVIVP